MTFQPSQFSAIPYGAAEEKGWIQSYVDMAPPWTPVAYFQSDDEEEEEAAAESAVSTEPATTRSGTGGSGGPPPPPQPFYAQSWFFPVVVVGLLGVGGAYYLKTSVGS